MSNEQFWGVMAGMGVSTLVACLTILWVKYKEAAKALGSVTNNTHLEMSPNGVKHDAENYECACNACIKDQLDRLDEQIKAKAD